MLYSIDRIEGTIAVLVDDYGGVVNEELSKLPEGVKEGSVLCRVGDTYSIDKLEIELRRNAARDIIGDIFT